MKKYSKVLSLLLALAMILPGFAQPVQAAEGVKLERLAGLDRVETAIKVSQKAYDKADTVVLAGYNGEADALTGTLLAKDKNAPVLLTYKDKLDADLVAELNRLGAKKVYILGGETVVFTAVETALKDAGFTTSRLKGDTRVETAVAIATEVLGSSTPTEAFAVEYNSLADALAIGPVAANKKAPILITYKNDVPAKTEEAMKAMQVKDLTVIGGTNALTEKGKMALEAITGKEVTRVSGSNRELTSLEIANKYNKNPKAVVVANGYKSADALVGGYFAAMMDAPILLTNTNKITLDVLAFIKDAEVNTYVLGGETAVSGDVYTKVEEQLVVTEEDLKVESVSAINAKTIEVKLNKAVVDTSKAEVELLRGTFKQNVTVKWAEDKTSVQLVGAGNFQAGDYTVNVKGLTDKVLTGTVEIEAVKVASIEILSDMAVLSSNPNGLITDQTATVGYIVKDQYGTDITKTTDLTTNDSNTVKILEKGTVTISGLTGKRVDDLVAVVLVHASSGTTVSKAVKLSAAATVADIQVDGVYDAKGKKVELKDNTKASDVSLVLNLKDQYGNDIKPGTVSDKVSSVIVTNTNPLVAKLASDKITVKAIDGKNRFVVEFAKLDASNEFKGGSAELLFIKTMDGKTFKHTINVVETQTTDSVSVGQPQFAISGEAVLLPITILDKEGNVIVDKDLLAHTTKGIKVNGNPAVKDNISVKDGQVYYKLATVSGVDGYDTATIITSTYKVATVTYKVTEAAKAVAVRGFKTPLILKAEKTETVEFKDVNVEDQYGRTMTNLTSGYTVNVKDISAEDGKVVTVSNNTITAGKANGAATVVLYLENSAIVGADKEVKNSAVEQQVRVTDGKEYTGYEIAPIGKVQAADVKGTTETPAGTSFTVNGILNGGKVALGTDEYTAEVVGKGVVTNEIKINKEDLNKVSNKPVDTEFTLRVTINATGKVLEQKFVVSPDASKTETFFFTEAEANSEVKDAKEFTKVLEAKGGTFNKDSLVNVLVTDQYGNKEIKKADDALLTIVPADASKVTINNNGKTDASATLVENAEETELTVSVKIGNATKEIKVNLKKAN